MSDRATALRHHLAEMERDFQKRFALGDLGDSGVNVDARDDVATEGDPQLQVGGEPTEEEIVWCRATWEGLATGSMPRTWNSQATACNSSPRPLKSSYPGFR